MCNLLLISGQRFAQFVGTLHMPICCLVHVAQPVLSLANVDCTSCCKALQVEPSFGYAALQLCGFVVRDNR